MPAGQGVAGRTKKNEGVLCGTQSASRCEEDMIISFVVENSAKEVIFYEEIYSFVHGFLRRIEAR